MNQLVCVPTEAGVGRGKRSRDFSTLFHLTQGLNPKDVYSI